MARMLVCLVCCCVVGCSCQQQFTMDAKFDPCNDRKPVESVNVQMILTR
jgi:hypothetical protein